MDLASSMPAARGLLCSETVLLYGCVSNYLWFWCLSSISFSRLLSRKYNTENLSKHHRERLRFRKHKISDNAWTKIFESYLDLFDVTFISTLTLLVTNRISLSDLKFFASFLSIRFQEPFVSGCGWSFNHMIYFFDWAFFNPSLNQQNNS